MPESPQPQVSTTIGVLSGTVSDPTGAKIKDAAVHVQSASLQRDATTDDAGHFSLPLPLGIYDVTIVAPGFTTYSTNITLTARDTHASIDARLVIATQQQQVSVSSENAASAADNHGAIVLKGSDLNAFSDDDSIFQQEIEDMASHGGQIPEIIVDGFANGRFPPKNTIAEIRVGNGGFSAEYDGQAGQRIEIFTKPGTGTLHGDFASSGTDNVFDGQNPYFNGPDSSATVEPPYFVLNLNGDLSGPINKKTSFFVSGVFNDLQNNAIVNATDPTLLTPLSEAVPAPQRTRTYGARIDRQVTASNLFIGRYEYNQVTLNNSGVGLLVLPSEGLNTTTTTQTLQLRDTQPFGSKVASEAHFQYIRTSQKQSPASTGAAVVAEGAFNSGGNPAQALIDKQDHYEFQEVLTVSHGSHLMVFGGRYRLQRDANYSRAGYNGQFIFPSLTAYQITVQGLAAGENDQEIRATCVTTPTGKVCGGPTQYKLTTGDASATLLSGDLGVFAEDQWQIRKNFEFDYGFRLESQSAVPDHFDPAPSADLSWAIGRNVKKPIITLHAESGIFYDRFPFTEIVTAIRQQSGTRQPSYILENPDSDFYKNNLNTPVPVTSLGSLQPTLYNVDPHMRTEYRILTDIWGQRSFGKFADIYVYWQYNRGNHQYLSRNINAPLPGTYDPNNPTNGVRPFGGTQNIYQFGSGGITKIINWYIAGQLHPTKRIMVGFGSYLSPSQKSDAISATVDQNTITTSSATSFPSNQYDPSADFGRIPSARATLSLRSTVQLPFGVNVGTHFALKSHMPFNITTGTDNNGDTIYNDRPAFATNPTANSILYKTRFGKFDANPQPGEKIIPFDYGDGPRYVSLALNLSKTFKFGPRPAPSPGASTKTPDRPYSLNFSIEADNVFNHVNPGQPVGVLSSPYFGQSISLVTPSFGVTPSNPSANRIIMLQTSVSF